MRRNHLGCWNCLGAHLLRFGIMNPECPVCRVKWGRSLWAGSCVCSGHVSPAYKGPDPAVPRQTISQPAVQEETVSKIPRISKKERQRLEKHGLKFNT